jgi:hypothetical protein
MDAGSVLEKIKEQEFYQQLQASYQQLSAEQQTQLKWGSAGIGFLVLFWLIFSVIKASNGAREEYYEKQEMARVINDASDEIRRLKGQSSGIVSSGGKDWKSIIEQRGTSIGIPRESLEVTKEGAGASLNVIQESLLELKLKNVQLRPLVQFLTQIEQGSPPMKLKGLQIETGAEEGKLSARVNLSGYLAKPEKEAGKK